MAGQYSAYFPHFVNSGGGGSEIGQGAETKDMGTNPSQVFDDTPDLSRLHHLQSYHGNTPMSHGPLLQPQISAPNSTPHHAHSLSYNEAAFPKLGSSPGHKRPSPFPSNSSPMNQGPVGSMPDLNDQMRRMIIKNEVDQASAHGPNQLHSTSQTHSRHQSRPSRRENQKARQQRQMEGQNLMTAATSSPAAHVDFPPYSMLPSAFPAQIPIGRQQPALPLHDPSYQSRPPPRRAHLYDPQSTPINPRDSFNQGPPTHVSQLQYLDSIMRREIANIEMSREEFDTKDNLRVKLEQICRNVVAGQEMPHTSKFDPSQVTLDCYGSLATTFGTTNGDMDLMLSTPESVSNGIGNDSGLPRLIEKELLDLGHGARLLTRTRVPIIKFCELPSPKLLKKLREARMKWEMERQDQRIDQGDAPHSGESLPLQNSDDREQLIESEAVEKSDGPGRQHAELRGDSQKLDTLQSSGDGAEASKHVCTGDEGQRSLQPGDESATASGGTSESKSQVDIEGNDPGLATKSDEDRIRLYRLAMREEWYELAERRTIIDFIEAHQAAQHSNEQVGPTQDRLSDARAALASLPNVLRRYRERNASPLDFPKSGVGIQCDINFSNQLGLHNSALLRCYSLCDPRVRPMVLFIKAWVKRRRINSAYESTLGSYGYVLMVLHYLINVAEPPVLPNLQHWRLEPDPNHINGPKMIDEHLVHFFRDENALREMQASGQGSINYSPLPALVQGFFAYYGNNAYPSFQWTHQVLSLRTFPGGLLSKESKGWTAAKTEHYDIQGESGGGGTNALSKEVSNTTDNLTNAQQQKDPEKPSDKFGTKPSKPKLNPQTTKEVRQRYLLAIEDPFETTHNVGRTVSHEGIVAIRDEMRRAHRLISTAGRGVGAGGRGTGGAMGIDGGGAFMDEAPERGNLLFKHFGPNPRRPRAKGAKAGGGQTGKQSGKTHPELVKTKDANEAGAGSIKEGGGQGVSGVERGKKEQ